MIIRTAEVLHHFSWRNISITPVEGREWKLPVTECYNSTIALPAACKIAWTSDGPNVVFASFTTRRSMEFERE